MEFYQALCFLFCLSGQLFLNLRFTTAQLCDPVQSDALLQFSNSLIVETDTDSHCDPKMTTWKNGLDCCSRDSVACDDVTGNVIGLDLSFGCLQGTLRSNSSLFALRHLQSLNLAVNDFRTSPILPELSLFTELNHLNLSSSNFSGLVPVEISYLSKLVLLDLSFNWGLQIENTGFKRLVQNLKKLRELELDWVDMSTVSPSSFVNLSSSLTCFSVSECNLRGELPPNIFSLPNLLHLRLDFNVIKISFPKSNWSKSLESLTLSDTSISGKIPDSIGESKNLKTLYLRYCTLTGSIPSSLVNLTKLTSLDLSSNELTGHTPSFVGKLARLIYLDLSFNDFTGVLDLGVLSTLKNLQVLRLTVELKPAYDSMNCTFPKLETLALPSSNLNLAYDSMNCTFPKLETLALPSSNLTKFPIFLSSLKKLRELDLSKNKIGGEIPRWIWDVGEGRLHVLDISSNLIEGGIQQFPLTELTDVDLSDNLFRGPLPIPPLCIVSFQAADNGFNGEIPSSICELSSLGTLNLARNNLSGSIPQCLGNLTNLFLLDLSANHFEGTFPRSLDNCASLLLLDVSFNRINDTFPKWLLESPSLERIYLQFNEFHGQIDPPTAPFLLSKLFVFSISNNNLGGQWPEKYFLHWLNLVVVDLSNNRFEGSVPIPPPTTFFYSIANNKIGGKVSPLICNANELIVLDLSNNSLMGTLPECLMSFSKSLSTLNLRMNMIQGLIPKKFAEGSNLMTIDFSQNRFEGTLPRSLLHCEYLKVLNLGNNRVEDTFPDWLGALTNLRVLVLRSNMFYGFVSSPTRARPFSELLVLDLSNNNLSGPLPVGYFMKLTAMMNQDKGRGKLQYMGGDGYQDSVTITMKGLEIRLMKILKMFKSIDLSNNRFEGPLPIPPPTTHFYSIANNKIGGKVSPLICNATELVILDLSNNSLMGTLPECLMSFSKNLLVLNLRMNMIQGLIPRKFAEDSKLRTIDFSRNRFEGTLPRSLLHCENLEVLDLSNNRVEDLFPDWLGTLPKLQVLVLRFNMFHGFVSSPTTARPFSELRIFDLSNNILSGPLPVGYIMKLTAMMNQDKGRGKLQYMGGDGYQDSVTVTMKGLEIQLVKILTVFTSIDLSRNYFGGELPVDIGNLKSLKGLNFSHNNLTGCIPPSIGNLTELEWLDLSLNKFTGRIPQELADLTYLGFLNLSENQLIGPIPQGRQFNTFKSDSFVGNLGLCEFPLPETCTDGSREIPPVTIIQENDTKNGGWFEWRAILMGYGCGIVAGISLGYIVLESRKFDWLTGLLEREGANMRKKWRRNARRSYQR